MLTRIATLIRHNARKNGSRCEFKPDLNTLFRYTSGYWLCNDKGHREARSVTFNVGAFCELASDAAGANAVTDMVKISESINRVFLVRFDTGREAIARFPTPLSGPPHFTTASEVATIDFLRRRGLPIPPVLAWSSRAESTDVGAEFILMEKAPGCLLSDHWDQLPRRDRNVFAMPLGQFFQRELLGLKFTHHGSLYYKKDVPDALRAPTLLEDISPEDELNSIFCIGPIVRRDFWEAERKDMDIDRGPWKTAEDYMTAVARREKEWISRFGTSHILDDPFRMFPGQGDRNDHISWLDFYTTFIPLIIPPLDEQIRPVIWHPDLHASNVFVKPSENQVPQIPLELSSMIDWQGTWIGPAFLQVQVPPLYHTVGVPPGWQKPSLPANFEELSESEKAQAKETLQRHTAHKVFEASAFPDLILRMGAHRQRTHLEDMAQVTWKYGLIPCRMAMYQVVDHWGEIMEDATPIQYSEGELDDFAAHHAKWMEQRELLEDMDREFGLGEFGYVKGDRDRFEEVRAAVERKKLEYVEQGHDEEAKMIRSHMWPYRDTLRDREVFPRLILR